MHQSSIVEYLAEQAHQQGARKTAREDILEALALRLQIDTAETFKPTLDAIEDLQRLRQLFRAAVLADTLEDFTQALESDNITTDNLCKSTSKPRILHS